MSSDSASIPSKLMFVVFGTRGSRVAVDRCAGHRERRCLVEPIAQQREARRRRLRASRRQRAATPRPASRDVLGARPAVALVLSAGHMSREPRRRA